MANTAKLRDQARAYEQRDQWREAIGTYRQILENREGEEVDIGLWNRIGDLHLRLTETEQAVDAYEAAVNAYVEVGLYNNAIALCRKILRLVPGRANIYRRLGQISAAKGFLADARQNFLEYADRMRRAGKLDESFEGLKEFADLSPDDVEVRRVLADQLLTHGLPAEAVEQLRILLGSLAAAGDEAAVEAVRAQIRQIDPDASTEPLARVATKTEAEDLGVFDPGEVDLGAPAAAEALPAVEELPPAAPPAGLELTAAVADEDDGPPELPAIEGLELSGDFSRPETAPAAPPPPRAADLEDDLPLIDFDAPADPRSPAAADPAAYGEVRLDDPADEAEDEGEPLPMLEPDDAYPTDSDDELPMLDMGDDFGAVDLMPAAEPEPAPRDRLRELRERVAAAPDDGVARDALVDLLHERGEEGEVAEVLEAAHRGLAARGAFRDAVAPISQLIRLRPGDGALLQKRVEYAFRSGDRSVMVDAYLTLARHFHTTGVLDKARAVFARVLEIEPYNPEARSALDAMEEAARRARPAPPPPPPPRPAPPPPSDYVDLGALILGDDDERETTTRFIVEEKEPTGDEDKDFADMLAHFRQKVAENIDAEDSASHYDLGLAFKEMGLIDEAIAEFQVALRGGANPLATLEILGQCFVEKGQYAVATRVLDRATRIAGAADNDLVGVLYQLARSHEALGHRDEAIELYERVMSVEIRFRDTAQRADALRAAG
ncbi:MAG TPA: tetratricopeptide repeat protein [Longimicrobium sp.]|jgi:tetratricopeptide (TPR) repeat protein